MTDYLLILRDHEQRWETFSPEEFQRIIGAFAAWNEKMQAEGSFVGAGKLTSDRGVTLRGRGGELVVDGPYAEAKEAIAGYYRIRAADIEQAGEIARGCPILTYGGSVEVRPMAGGGQ